MAGWGRVGWGSGGGWEGQEWDRGGGRETHERERPKIICRYCQKLVDWKNLGRHSFYCKQKFELLRTELEDQEMSLNALVEMKAHKNGVTAKNLGRKFVELFNPRPVSKEAEGLVDKVVQSLYFCSNK